MSNAFCAVIAFQVSQLVKDPFAEDELTTIRISHFNFPISPYILSAMANGLPGISVRVFATNSAVKLLQIYVPQRTLRPSLRTQSSKPTTTQQLS